MKTRAAAMCWSEFCRKVEITRNPKKAATKFLGRYETTWLHVKCVFEIYENKNKGRCGVSSEFCREVENARKSRANTRKIFRNGRGMGATSRAHRPKIETAKIVVTHGGPCVTRGRFKEGSYEISRPFTKLLGYM